MRHSTRWVISPLLVVLLLTVVPASATSSRATGPKPFILPFASLPGPNTWYMGQLYGNTTGAFYQRDTLYRAGQGLHFGIDLAAPCGTPIVAVGEGAIASVDAEWLGSMPHNLMLKTDAGYAILYGHLLERPQLAIGQRVTRGQVIAKSGDSFGTCRSAPHLHLETRDLSYTIAYNPVDLIDADWDSLALIGSFQRGFERDLNNPRRWQYPDDQPDTHFGGPLLNNFAQPWPPDWNRR